MHMTLTATFHDSYLNQVISLRSRVEQYNKHSVITHNYFFFC